MSFIVLDRGPCRALEEFMGLRAFVVKVHKGLGVLNYKFRARSARRAPRGLGSQLDGCRVYGRQLGDVGWLRLRGALLWDGRVLGQGDRGS